MRQHLTRDLKLPKSSRQKGEEASTAGAQSARRRGRTGKDPNQAALGEDLEFSLGMKREASHWKLLKRSGVI